MGGNVATSASIDSTEKIGKISDLVREPTASRLGPSTSELEFLTSKLEISTSASSHESCISCGSSVSSSGSLLTRGGVVLCQRFRRGECIACLGETTTTNLPVFVNLCSGAKNEPTDSNSASSNSKPNNGSTISKEESCDFAASAVDIPISREMGNSGATSALFNSTSANSNGIYSELGTSTSGLGPSATGLLLRAFRSGPSAPGLPPAPGVPLWELRVLGVQRDRRKDRNDGRGGDESGGSAGESESESGSRHFESDREFACAPARGRNDVAAARSRQSARIERFVVRDD